MSQSKTQQARPADPCIMVIFGMSGDLTKRLLYPAICNLGSSGLMDPQFQIVGVATDASTTDSFRQKMKQNVKEFVIDPDSARYGEQLTDSIEYISGNFKDQATYDALSKMIQTLQQQKTNKNVIFYFASPPQLMRDIAVGLNAAGLLNEENGKCFRRIVVEKPFGNDLASARQLNHDLLALMDEHQIFRIDHFLGKETVQNILAFRFANALFEPIWNHQYIDHVQISASEVLGVELRGGYYDKVGALRDMIPNHLMQMLSLIAMEPPVSLDSQHIQVEKNKVLQAVKIPTRDQVSAMAVRGQYGAGVINDKQVPRYQDEAKIAPQSPTETFAALKLSIDNWRWLNVPFYLRTGKRMKTRTTEVTIQFKPGASSLFSDGNVGALQNVQPDVLRFNIQPNEGISLQFNTKIPGTTMSLQPVEMAFKYKDYFNVKPSTGYETILYETMTGNHLLFSGAETVELSWAIVEPVLEAWGSSEPTGFPNYDAGSWGPQAADALLNKDGRKWYP